MKNFLLTLSQGNAMTKAQKDKLREFDAALSDKNYQKRKSFTERLRDCFSDK